MSYTFHSGRSLKHACNNVTTTYLCFSLKTRYLSIAYGLQSFVVWLHFLVILTVQYCALLQFGPFQQFDNFDRGQENLKDNGKYIFHC